MLKQALTKNDRQTDRQTKDRGETDTKRQIKGDRQRQTDRDRESAVSKCIIFIYMPCPLCPACMELTIMISGVSVKLTVAGATILDEDLIGG